MSDRQEYAYKMMLLASALLTIGLVLMWFAFFILREWTHA